MSKYKTIELLSVERTIEDAIQYRFAGNRPTKPLFAPKQEEGVEISPNKNILLIKLPNRREQITNNFRFSLYQPSIKRLKQQQITTIIDTIPILYGSRSIEDIEEQKLIKTIKEKKQQKKQAAFRQSYFNSNQNSQNSIHVDKSQSIKDPRSSLEKISLTELIPRKTNFETDGTAFGFKNLKQKYLQLQQLSLNNHKKSELLDKPQYRRYNNQMSHLYSPEIKESRIRLDESLEGRYKMEPIIQKHMQRYDRRASLEANIKGRKTVIYPLKEHQKQIQQMRIRKKQEKFIRQEHVDNFIRRRKPVILSSRPQADIIPHSKTDQKGAKIYNTTRRDVKNPQGEQRSLGAWQTQASVFDRF